MKLLVFAAGAQIPLILLIDALNSLVVCLNDKEKYDAYINNL